MRCTRENHNAEQNKRGSHAVDTNSQYWNLSKTTSCRLNRAKVSGEEVSPPWSRRGAWCKRNYVADLSAVNQDLGAAFEEHLDLGVVFDSGGDTDAEARMFHHVTGLISFFRGIGPRLFRTTFLQKALIAACARLARLKSGNSLTGFGRFVSVLRIAGIAVHARRPGADHRLDGVGEHHFAFAAPTVNCPAGSILVISFHYSSY